MKRRKKLSRKKSKKIFSRGLKGPRIRSKIGAMRGGRRGPTI